MVRRPTSVVVIAWLLLILGAFAALGCVLMMLVDSPEMRKAMEANPIPAPYLYAMMIAGTTVQLVSGFFMLKGRNWSRYLYVIWSLVSIGIALATSPMKESILPGSVMIGVFIFFLFRPAANAFFADNGEHIDPQGGLSVAELIGVFFYLLAGFFLACTGMGALMVISVPLGKAIALCFLLFPFGVCLGIGCWQLPERWKRDIGLTIVLGAISGALMSFMMVSMYANPEFQKSIPPDQLQAIQEMQKIFTDYTFATIWFVAWTFLGGALLLLDWSASQSETQKP